MRRLSAVAPYPTGIMPIPETISGTAFFPGGYGLWMEESNSEFPAMPIGGIMILGHDFDCEHSYKASLKTGHELNSPTWRSLRKLLEEAGIPLQDCFFTNFYMGIRKGNTNTGKFPGANDAEFTDRCTEFLQLQVQTMQPRAILTLGAWIPRKIALMSEQLNCWIGKRDFRSIDASGPVVCGCMFNP